MRLRYSIRLYSSFKWGTYPQTKLGFVQPFVAIAFAFFTSFLLNSCEAPYQGIRVSSIEDFDKAVAQAKPGDIIILAKGPWKDVELNFSGEGEENAPITLTVEEKGAVFLEGNSNLRLGGSYLHVEGLVFRNGYTPTSSVIEYRIGEDLLCNNCRVTECVVDDYNPPERFDSDYWVAIYGKRNRFDHNYLVGKRNQGVTLAVRLNSTESQENHHRIDHNYFGYHPILGSNGGETFRIGTSHYSLSNSNTLVEDNYFERCNGEHEIVSNKSCQNTFRNNTFYECQGTLTMRHGNETLVENNYFFGNQKANTGGIRIINETQTVRNNYCEGLTGYRFRGALVIMNGVPNSPLNRYFQVIDSKASNNLIINSDYIQLCAGSDEERSATPVNTEVENNIFYHSDDKDIFTIYDEVSGIAFSQNYLSSNLPFPQYRDQSITRGFEQKNIELETVNGVKKAKEYPEIGPDLSKERPGPDNTGVSWYPKKEYRIRFNTGKILSVGPEENGLFDAVKNSSPGDILELTQTAHYHQTKSIDIVHPLTIRASRKLTEKPMITFERTSLFNLENGGSLKLEGLEISGKKSDDKPGNTVIRTSRYSMINNYKLLVTDCDIKNLDVNHSFEFIKVYKNTFADSIALVSCTFENITGHILAADKEFDDIGIYNVENVLIDQSTFKDIGGAVLHLYRGGRDESTFGPILDLTHSSFENVGHDKRNKFQATVALHGVQLAEMNELIFVNSRKLDLHLIVGEPVIRLRNSRFENSEGVTSNDNAWIRSNNTGL
ncbi:MAG: chondroitinase-B domain-containing protein [Bacteroidota bacterium]